jgi:hypothetical protein
MWQPSCVLPSWYSLSWKQEPAHGNLSTIQVKELGTTSAQAEDALRQSNGNLEEALKDLISPPDVKLGWRTRV